MLVVSPVSAATVMTVADGGTQSLVMGGDSVTAGGS